MRLAVFVAFSPVGLGTNGFVASSDGIHLSVSLFVDVEFCSSFTPFDSPRFFEVTVFNSFACRRVATPHAMFVCMCVFVF